MYKIGVIIPFFGKLPMYWPAFVKSIPSYSLDVAIDFLLFTDDKSAETMCSEVEVKIPNQLKIRYMDFSAVTNRIMRLVDGKVEHAYKLCDYKAVYGELFEYEIRDYDYWGYCDIDTMMGDVPTFLMNNKFYKYDRYGDKGHFTIYRNTPEMRKLYQNEVNGLPLTCRFSFVKNTAFPCHYDEIGMNLICEFYKLPFYNKNNEAQITIVHDLHFHTFKDFDKPQLFTWEYDEKRGCGHTYVYTDFGDGNIQKDEYMYCHYQARKVMPITEKLENRVLISHLGFMRFDPDKKVEYMKTVGAVDSIEERQCFLRKEKADRKRGDKFMRELRMYKLRAFYNIYGRISSILYFRRNNLFQ